MIEQIKNSRRVILLEPNYRRKYMPLGLAKIASMVKSNGGEVFYQRVYTPLCEDAVCITSLFTYDSEKVINSIKRIKYLSSDVPIFVGGVYASLMPNHLLKNCPNIQIFQGYSQELDSYPADYTINWDLEQEWSNFSYLFTSRGCPNRCPYCAVSRLEPQLWINDKWSNQIDLNKPFVMIFDNNLTSQPIEHIENVCKFLKENNKKVVFDNGFDCKYFTSEHARLLSTVKYLRNGFRLAFDRIEEDGQFQKAVEIAIKAGISSYSMMAYVLFNFHDSPKEANYRMSECLKHKIFPYPQQYIPLHSVDRKSTHVGEKWTKNLLKCFRHFWLMPAIHTKMTFEEFVTRDNVFKLTEEDWAKWNA